MNLFSLHANTKFNLAKVVKALQIIIYMIYLLLVNDFE